MKRIHQLSALQVFLFFAVVAIFVRFPFFFRDYVDHDESTFILMGQAMVDGHLPYLKFWDLKPPLVFYFFAGIIAVFGKSFIVIRLMGSLVVAATAWFSYKLSAMHFDKMTSFFTGFLTIYLLSLFGAMQGVMSEHLAALPLVAGIYYLSINQNIKNLLISGFLFGLAIMCRLNLAYALFIVYAYTVLKNGFNWNGIQKGFWLTVAAFFAFFLCFLPYIISGNFDVLQTSVFEASLAYSSVSWSKMFKTIPMLLVFLLVCGLSYKFLKFKSKPNAFLLIIIMIIGQCLMFFKSGKVNGHYLIQVFPFAAILLVGLLSKIPLKGKVIQFVPKVVFVLFLLIPFESYLEYVDIFKSKSQNGTFYNGEGNTIPAYLIKTFGTEKPKNIFFLNEHIGYWVLDTNPPTAISSHPSNIVRETAYPYVKTAHKNPFAEMQFILNEKRPNFIVYDERRIPMVKDGVEFLFLQEVLDKNYVLEKTFGNKNQVKLFRQISIQAEK